MRERLGHEGRDQPPLLGQGFDHVTKENRPITRGQRVGVLEVLLELPVGVFVVGGVVVPPQAGDRVRHLGDEVEVAGQGPHVVTGLIESVERVGELELAVGTAAQQEVLELGADLQLVALGADPLDRVAQDRPRAVGPGLALDGDVAGKARHGRAPGQDRQRRRVGHGDDVGVIGALADVAGGKAGKPRALAEEVIEVVGGDELGVRLAVHVDELREQELDLLVLDDPAYVVVVLGGSIMVARYIHPARGGAMDPGTRW